MNESRRLGAIVIVVALVSQVVFCIYAQLVLNALLDIRDAVKPPAGQAATAQQVPGQTVVYVKGGSGDESIPLYEAPGVLSRETLPSGSPVEMECWVDNGGERWFRILFTGRETATSGRPYVRAAHLHNQRKVDSC